MHDSDNCGELWHKRLGHLNYGALSILKGMVQGLSNFKFEKKEVCKSCTSQACEGCFS